MSVASDEEIPEEISIDTRTSTDEELIDIVETSAADESQQAAEQNSADYNTSAYYADDFEEDSEAEVSMMR